MPTRKSLYAFICAVIMTSLIKFALGSAGQKLRLDLYRKAYIIYNVIRSLNVHLFITVYFRYLSGHKDSKLLAVCSPYFLVDWARNL